MFAKAIYISILNDWAPILSCSHSKTHVLNLPEQTMAIDWIPKIFIILGEKKMFWV